MSDKEKLLTSKETVELIEAMGKIFPDAKAELVHKNSFELLISVILSAQTTDISVNKVTPALFREYPTPELLMEAPLDDIMNKIKTIGLYRNKSKFIKKCSRELVENFGGVVPSTHKELESLSGVGRKTANVVMSVAFDKPAIAVDTHVERISKKFNICSQKATVRQVENTLMEKLPEDLWSIAHHRMIFFGRYQCPARAHDHNVCIEKIKQQIKS
ncbi:endonuclease III [Marinilactibacillus sp. 15R]|uniref:Endonuclease III n=1 Tax=Marinilactibacillus piezotolerans TaxID=258723 RepID=A0A1I3V3Y5_9LACT|nr:MULTISPECIES: endonuclease III [Marinilactibacillus]API89590.1 endonuclease III [Marinilactibacillus sp. 15R]SFJ90364.1 DNA-(apurinic or apyrimidinic site) lyase /endonuclease III [Marinilactibacillus piezotolerans]